MEFGLLGSISSIPTDFELATAAFVGAGVNDAGSVCVVSVYSRTSDSGPAHAMPL